MDKQKEEKYRLQMWDYDITPEEVDKLIRGETDRAGHYNKEKLLLKIFNNLTWYDIIKIVPINEISAILSDDFIKKLRFTEIQNRYARIQKILRRETLSPAKHYFETLKRNPYSVLSHRW